MTHQTQTAGAQTQITAATGGKTVEMLHGEATDGVANYLTYRPRKGRWEVYQMNVEIGRQMRVADDREKANQKSYLLVMDGVSLVVKATHKRGRGEVVVDDISRL